MTSADAREQQRVGDRDAVAHGVGDALEVGVAGGAVDQRQPVQQRGRAHRADDQVLQAGLQRGGAARLGGAQHVQRDRQQLQADEQRDQVLGAGQDDHAQDRAQQQGHVLARAGLARHVGAHRQHDRGQAHHEEQQAQQQRQGVDGQRAGDDRVAVARLPVGDAQPARGQQRGGAHQRAPGRAGPRGRGTGRPSAPAPRRPPAPARATGPCSRSRAPWRRRAGGSRRAPDRPSGGQRAGHLGRGLDPARSWPSRTARA